MILALTKGKQYWAWIAIVVIGVVCYANSMHVPFQFDDLPYIEKNRNIRDLSDVTAIWNSLSHPSRFVAFYTFAINYHFGKYDVFGYHVFNLIIHILTGLFVYGLVLQLCRSKRLQGEEIISHKDLLAFVVAAIFVAHPIQTQAVTYIVQRFASLATMFYVLTLFLYVKGRITGLRRFFGAAVFTMVMGMFTKQITFTLPVMVFITELCFFSYNQDFKTLLRTHRWGIFAGLMFMLIIPGIFGFNLQRIFGMTVSSGNYEGDIITAPKYLLTQFRVIPVYLKLLVWPLNQSIDYQFPLSQTLFETKTFLGFIFLLGLFGFGLYQLKRNVFVAYGIIWFFVTLSVESSVIPIHHVIYEHRCYLPSVGIFLVLGWLIVKFVKPFYLRIGIIAGLIGVLVFLTVSRNVIWQDKIALWENALSSAPGQFKVHDNLGYEYWKSGDFDKALEHFNKAIEINPAYPGVYNNRGGMFSEQGKTQEAIKDLKKALSLNPSYADALYNLGRIYYEEKDLDLALAYYTKAIEVNRKYAEAYNNRGNVYGELEQYDLAMADFNMALQFEDEVAHTYYHRAYTWKKMGNIQAALDDYTQAIELDPEYAEAYNNRGNIYNQNDEQDKALEDYSKAIEFDDQLFNAYYSRGLIFKDRMDLVNAYEDFSKFIELNPEESGAALFQRSLMLSAMRRNQEAYADALKSQELGYPIDEGYLSYLRSQL